MNTFFTKTKFLLLPVFAYCLITVSCSSSTPNNDWTKMKLKNSPQSIKTSFYRALDSFGKIKKIKMGVGTSNGRTNTSITFNESGDKTREERNNGFKLVTRLFRYHYNEKGRKVKRKSIYLLNHKDTLLTSHRYYTYNTAGRLAVRRDYKITKKDSSFMAKRTFRYDRKRNKQKELLYNGKDSVSNTLTYRYDDFGNPLEKKGYTSDDKLLFTYKNTFDKAGHKIEVEYSDRRGNSHSVRYKYKFDEQGNWVRRLEYNNGQPEYIAKRKISYY